MREMPRRRRRSIENRMEIRILRFELGYALKGKPHAVDESRFCFALGAPILSKHHISCWQRGESDEFVFFFLSVFSFSFSASFCYYLWVMSCDLRAHAFTLFCRIAPCRTPHNQIKPFVFRPHNHTAVHAHSVYTILLNSVIYRRLAFGIRHCPAYIGVCVRGTNVDIQYCVRRRVSLCRTLDAIAPLFSRHCVCVSATAAVCDASAWTRCFRFTRNKLNGSHVRRICCDGVCVCTPFARCFRRRQLNERIQSIAFIWTRKHNRYRACVRACCTSTMYALISK